MSVNVAQYFTDPDGDTLTYSATSSNAGVATGSVAGSTVTLTPVGVGTATITVTARDPGGLTATQSIAVTVASGPSSDDHGNMPATATFIGANSSTAGTLEQGSDVDYFRLVLSARTTLTAESTGNTDTVGQLEASDGSVIASNDDGAGSGVNFRIREEVPAGTYYIQVSGFLNDAGPYTLVVSSAGTPSEIPDLVVESPAVSSGAVAPDESFTLSATVRNQGAGAAGSTTLRYYQSRDSTITTGDTGVGTDAVPALTGNRTSSESISLRAPNSAGTYYYGACVDAVGGESDTGNNCSIGVRVVVSSSSDDHGDTRATATPIGSNSSTPGTLDHRGDLDYFRLVLSARTTLTAESTGNTDTFGQLEASNGSVLASNDDGGSGSNFSIREEVSAGTYYIQVRGYSPDVAGPYTLVVSSATTGGGGTGSRQVTVSNVVFEPDTGSGYYAITGEIANTGSGALDGWTTWARFYRTDGTLVVEEYERRRNTLNASERTQFSIDVEREDTLGWRYFLVSLVADDAEVPCVGCGERHAPPAPGPCGIPFDEAIAVTRQCSSGSWWASGPVQGLSTCWATEREVLDLVTNENNNGFFLERIGTADFQRRADETLTGVRLWSAGHILASYDRDLRDKLSNIACLP